MKHKIINKTQLSKNKLTPPSTTYHLPSTNPAFTIVELLVVIVVIGILAAITIVSYTGISQKAITASLQSDLANASKQLQIFKVNSPTEDYPTAINCTNPTST
jgi:prepilin-type N-terminal cleavage/methylation domain-containing protein